MLESALPLLYSTCLAGKTARAVAWHWQSGQHHSCWLESAWPFASLYLPGQYLQLKIDSVSSGPAAAWSRLLEPARKFNLNLLWKFKFKFTGKLITIFSSFNVLSQILKLKVKKCRGYKYEMCTQWLAARSTEHCNSTCQSYDLGVAASLTWRFRPGVTVFFFKL